ncbi:hypothetical protein RFI_09571 [Reticulomyxa filosa]|uniref:Kelch motif family protein n=1 Tax=Reticulomyxa filosa TaxID=46433 RepID=X6NNP2_RETFI|nr:hypothetical protein RFI_09571 [Reticulomyxa filosa]|eukprot:ETO27558.1 hypothetical protein RFI_09571 [Reticulomyxa filosa]
MTTNSFGFQLLPSLPTKFCGTQCISFNNEILICGGCNTNQCYSYHTKKDKYKYVCSYPSNVRLDGHAVVKYETKNKSGIAVLSIGGGNKQILTMSYESVWSKTNEHKNEWTEAPYKIGGSETDTRNVRAIIGGRNKNLLFVVHYPNCIFVLDLQTSRQIAQSVLPINNIIGGSCFVQTNNEMILFNKHCGLSIQFDESKQQFECHKMPICSALKNSCYYFYIYVQGFIVLLGGYDSGTDKYMDKIYAFSVKTKTWSESSHKLPIPAATSFAIVVNVGHTPSLHIIGGDDGNKDIVQHLRISIENLIGRVLNKNHSPILAAKE